MENRMETILLEHHMKKSVGNVMETGKYVGLYRDYIGIMERKWKPLDPETSVKV